MPSLNLDNLGTVAALLFFSLLAGGLAWGIPWAFINVFLKKHLRLADALSQWRVLRAIGNLATGMFASEEILDGGRRRKWEWLRLAVFMMTGFLIFGGAAGWGAYKRSVQWYAIEPPPDISQGMNPLALRPDPDAPLSEWEVKGIFWTKEKCLKQIRQSVEDTRQHAGKGRYAEQLDSFVTARRCLPARSPYAPDPYPSQDSDSDDSRDE